VRVKTVATLPRGISKKRISGLLMSSSGPLKLKNTYAIRTLKDKVYKDMYRIRWEDGSLSDMVNNSRAKDAIREYKEYQKAQACQTAQNEIMGSLA
jgi:hypothetical protein